MIPPPLEGAEVAQAPEVAQGLKANTIRDVLAECPTNGGADVDVFSPRALTGLDDSWLEAICVFLRWVLILGFVPPRMAVVSIISPPQPTDIGIQPLMARLLGRVLTPAVRQWDRLVSHSHHIGRAGLTLEQGCWQHHIE